MSDRRFDAVLAELTTLKDFDELQIQRTVGTPGKTIAGRTGSYEDWCRALDVDAPQPPLSVFVEFQTAEIGVGPFAYLFIDIHRFDEVEYADRYVERFAVELADCTGIDLLMEPSGASGTFTVEALRLASTMVKRNVYPNDGSISIRIPAGHVVADVRVRGVTPDNLEIALQELAVSVEFAAQAILDESN